MSLGTLTLILFTLMYRSAIAFSGNRLFPVRLPYRDPSFPFSGSSLQSQQLQASFRKADLRTVAAYEQAFGSPTTVANHGELLEELIRRLAEAPRVPGVYLFRDAGTLKMSYVKQDVKA